MTDYSDWLWDKFREWENLQRRRTSQMAFARYLGVSQPSLNHWMNGDNPPTGDHVHRLAAKLGYEIYDILGVAPQLPEPMLKISVEWKNIPPDAQVQLAVDLTEFMTRWLEDHGFNRVK